MTSLALFKALSFKELQKSPEGEARIRELGIVADIVGQHYIGSGQMPKAGTRLTEYKYDDAAASFDHRGGITHYRPGPWQVDRVEEYVGNTGMEEHTEIVVCHCRYATLPDHENPWVEMAPAVVSVESFGGDVAAYEAWKATQVVTV
jgi:hypothetical protein